MTQRPERVVGEAGVVPLVLFRRQPDAPKPVRRRVRRHLDGIPLVDDSAVSGAGSVGDPDAAALAHQRVERDRHAAGCRADADRSVLGVVMRPGLAIGHDHETGARAADLARLSERRLEENRADDIVQRDDRDDERLEPAPPRGKFIGDQDPQPERDPRLRHEGAPEEAGLRRLDAGNARAEAGSPPDENEPHDRDRHGNRANRRQRLEVDRGAGGRKEQHEDRHRAPFDRVSEHVAGGGRGVLHHHASGDGGEQRLEVPAPAERRQHDAERDEHERELAADEAQVEREQRPDDGAERERPQNLPRRRGEKRERRALVRSEREPRELHAEREQQDDDQVREHDERHRQLGQRPSRAALRDHRDRHRRREPDEDGRRERGCGRAPESHELRANRQPRPREVHHGEQPRPGHRDRDAANRRDLRQPRAQPAEIQLEARDEPDDRDRQAVGDAKVARHRLLDDVGDIRAAHQTEREVAGDPRKMGELEQPPDNGRRDECDAERQRGGTRAGVAETADQQPRERDRDRQRAQAPHSLRPGGFAPADPPTCRWTTRFCSSDDAVPDSGRRSS